LSAAPVRSSGRRTRHFSLTVREIATGLVVREKDDLQHLLPRRCPQRHINADGYFCLGLRAGEGIRDAITARQWWEKLQVFLFCQETAHETGEWPSYAELSHGDAGEYQQRAERLAEQLGAIDQYRQAFLYGTGSIAEVSPSQSDHLHTRQ
jgi:hypothetical protein